MLESSPVVAVVAVKDLERARQFYGGTLGLKESPDGDPGGVLYQCGAGTQLLVYSSGFAGGNQATAASWEVEDVAGAVAELKDRGVSFEQYDNIPDVERDGDVHRSGRITAAWFKDPDGNILNVVHRG